MRLRFNSRKKETHHAREGGKVEGKVEKKKNHLSLEQSLTLIKNWVFTSWGRGEVGGKPFYKVLARE